MSDREVLTYGMWRRPRSFGVGKLGLAGMCSLGIGVAATFVLLHTVGWVAAMIVMGADGAATMTLLVPDRHGQSRGQRLVVRAGWSRARSGRRNIYRSGPVGKSVWGSCQLPGVLASTRLHEFEDGWGRAFAVLEMPRRGQFSITFTGQAQGRALVDQDQVDLWVAGWADFMALLANSGQVKAMSVTVESSPDGGQRLRRRVNARMDENAPALARQVMTDVLSTYPAGAAQIRVWVCLTWAAQQLGSSRRRKPAEFAEQVAGELPALCDRMSSTGLSKCRPVSCQELCELTRGAYDPQAWEAIADAHAAGETPLLRWQDVGPIGADTHWDHYRHDSGVSVTWAMSMAPRGLVRERVLAHLLEPDPQIERKRVTLLYRVIDAAQSAELVAADARNARSRVRGAANAAQDDRRNVALAEQVEREESDGATVVDFGLLATITLTDADRETLSQAAAWIEKRGLASKIVLRRVVGSQDSAFAACLPLGVVLSEYMTVPRELRGGL